MIASMHRRVRSARDRERGFTAIEILAVAAMLALLLALALPSFLGGRQKARTDSASPVAIGWRACVSDCARQGRFATPVPCGTVVVFAGQSAPGGAPADRTV